MSRGTQFTADTGAEWLALLDDTHISIVRTAGQLKDVLAGKLTLEHASEALFEILKRLRKLSSNDRDIIVGELDFNDRGLVHGGYTELKKYLNDNEIYDFFSIFGISRILAADYVNNYCSDPGTCSKKIDKICTSNCNH